jgi:hypothetical protein
MPAQTGENKNNVAHVATRASMVMPRTPGQALVSASPFISMRHNAAVAAARLNGNVYRR